MLKKGRLNLTLFNNEMGKNPENIKEDKMKKAAGISLFFLLFGALFLGSVAYGADLKVGYVDMQRALNESGIGKKAKADLESLIKSKQTVIDEKGKEVEAFRKELDKQGTILSDEARKTKQDELDRKMRDYKRLVQDAQAEVKKKENELTGQILLEIKNIVKEIGKKENYTLILENFQEVLLYVDKRIDLTDKVIKILSEKMKAKK
ncbi:MAG TPA: OmpH family outer membrane protein [Nitrospirae bacterium]|nr:OmpH family outer membrane protein [Nitrospirota bacterium]HDY70869.1 OmpH family outer membrane protein [Nitrospirota bacterium]